jgi:excinuclease ABC subunit B
MGIKTHYLHSEVQTLDRVEILRDLRLGVYDVVVGINLLREGLDLPEVSLVCILDADKEGFLRNTTSLVQTAGRAARHITGECVLFCDVVTDSIQHLLDLTNRRRLRQQEHNERHGITPQGIKRAIQQSLHHYDETKESADHLNQSLVAEDPDTYDRLRVISELEAEMREASSKLEFERAAHLRDQIAALNNQSPASPAPPKPTTYPKAKRGRKSR